MISSMKVHLFGFCLTFLMSNLIIAAATPEEAAALFSQRNSSPAGVKAADDAINAYESLIDGLKGEPRAEAVDRLGRLAYYRGEMLGKDSASNSAAGTELKKEERAKIFDRCRTHASKIKLDANGAQLPPEELDFNKLADDYRTPFTYWYYLCTALWFRDTPINVANLNTLADFFHAVVDQKSLEILKDLPVSTNYLAGGLQRALAGSFTNPSAKFINKNLPNQEKALALINIAIKSPSADDLGGMTDPVAGRDYFSNYRVKIDILMNSNKKDEAKIVAAEAIAKIESLISNNRPLPKGHEPETKQDLLLLKDQVAKYKL